MWRASEREGAGGRGKEREIWVGLAVVSPKTRKNAAKSSFALSLEPLARESTRARLGANSKLTIHFKESFCFVLESNLHFFDI